MKQFKRYIDKDGAGQRVHTTLSVCVETVDFDGVACILHLKGKSVAENEYVKKGQYHTLDIAVGRKFQLSKQCWDSIDLDRLNLALDVCFNMVLHNKIQYFFDKNEGKGAF
ncbi:unnamed protein product [Gongylonema pulchrum]|uniref:ERF1_1 domain-containing protein n=1 Tax=Gongylonema pulchrum TaxID=637853 RepID=A0A183ETP8_9BILA|nr:unnamed protein product [Gongylonema pulchrum]